MGQPSSALTFTATAAWASAYVYRGLYYGGASLQPQVEADWDGAAAGVWADDYLQAVRPNVQVDYYGTYTAALNADVSLEPGVNLYTFPFPSTSIPGARTHTVVEPNLALNVTIGRLRLSPTVYYDVTQRSLTCEANASYTVPLPLRGWETDWLATLGSYETRNQLVLFTATPPDPSAANRVRGAYALLQSTVAWPLGARLRASATLGWSAGFFDEAYVQGTAAERNPLEAHGLVATLALAYNL